MAMHRTQPRHDAPLQQVDYDLHGLVGIRVIDASIADAATVARQLGPLQKPLSGEPDIIIRFVDRLPGSSSLCYLGADDAGFTEEAFVLLQGRVRAQIPFRQIGKQCEIVCERGLHKVPLLIPIVNLTVLSKGALPLHASAFCYHGTGVLIAGWAKGGKTETLLAFMAQGAVYIGDEWIYLSADGQQMYGLPERIRVWDSHLRELPRYRRRIDRGDRTRLRMLKLFIQLFERRISSGSRQASVMGRLIRLLKRQQFVLLQPQKLFGNRVATLAGTPSKVFFVVSQHTDEVNVQPMDPQEVARRMAASLQYERLDFMSYYLKYRFAFPEARNEFIERACELERDMLVKALAGKPAYVVYHPYPAPIPALFDAISPLIGRAMAQGNQYGSGRSTAVSQWSCLGAKASLLAEVAERE